MSHKRIRHHLTGERMFVAFTVLWVLDDAVAVEDQMLTDAARRINVRHPVLWKTALGLTFLHLADLFEPMGMAWADPYTNAAKLTRCAIKLVRKDSRAPRISLAP